MHELSIAQELVEQAAEAAVNAGAVRVLCVRLQVGALAGVVDEALLFCYDVATEGTVLEGSHLEIEHQPVCIYCARCGQERELPGIQSLRCPVCQTLSGDVRRGRELLLLSLELEANETGEDAAIAGKEKDQ